MANKKQIVDDIVKGFRRLERHGIDPVSETDFVQCLLDYNSFRSDYGYNITEAEHRVIVEKALERCGCSIEW